MQSYASLYLKNIGSGLKRTTSKTFLIEPDREIEEQQARDYAQNWVKLSKLRFAYFYLSREELVANVPAKESKHTGRAFSHKRALFGPVFIVSAVRFGGNGETIEMS